MKTLCVGDIVLWKGSWGGDRPERAKVVGIDKVEPGEKYGHEVKEMEWKKVAEEAVVSLDNGHWAYGYQIEPWSGPSVY